MLEVPREESLKPAAHLTKLDESRASEALAEGEQLSKR